MPNRDVHVKVGVGSAICATVATAIVLDEKLTFEEMLLRVLGASIGGYMGARVPDIIDPSSRGPNHRSIGHGVVSNGTLYAFSKDKFLDTRKKLSNETEQRKRLFNQFIVGAMEGFVTGHASHLVLDSRTPKGLPLVV